MLAIEYYRKLKNIYPNEVHKCKYIYIYTNDGVVENVLFKFRKNKGKNGCLFIDDEREIDVEKGWGKITEKRDGPS